MIVRIKLICNYRVLLKTLKNVRHKTIYVALTNYIPCSCRYYPKDGKYISMMVVLSTIMSSLIRKKYCEQCYVYIHPKCGYLRGPRVTIQLIIGQIASFYLFHFW